MEITKEYARAYVEVLEVIKNLKNEEYERIPKSKIDLYEKYKDTDYNFDYNPEENLDNQISSEAKNVLANLFLKYISTQEDRTAFYEKERKERYKEEVNKTYSNLNPLFEDKNNVTLKKENTEIVVQNKKENIIVKIFKKIKIFLGF